MKNWASVTFTIAYQKTYDIVWSGVSVVNTIIALFKSVNTITATLSALVDIHHTITSNIAFTLSAKLQSVLNVIFASATTLAFTVHERLKFPTTVESSIAFSYVFRQTIKFYETITLNVGLTFEPILASFYLLSDYDAVALSTMDTSTLGNLDYSTA